MPEPQDDHSRDLSESERIAEDLRELQRAASDPGDSAALSVDEVARARELLLRIRRAGPLDSSQNSDSECTDLVLPPASVNSWVDAPSSSLPMQIDHYVIEDTIARGGMGIVFRARDVDLNRIVALKVMNAGPLADPEDRERFRGEAEAAARLDHPGIVSVFDVGQYNGQPYFTMSYIEGPSVATRIARGPLAADEAAELTRQIALSISYAHASGIIHRDVKPANVLLDETGNARVTDFGLARRVDSACDLTRTGQVIGTPDYMSPEQAAGKQDEMGPGSDVYSIGATLYAMLTGHPPFQSTSTVQTIRMVLEREPIAPRQLNPAVPVDLSTICMKCLQKSASQRYSSASQLAEDLQRFLNHEPVHARMPSRAIRFARWSRRRPFAASLILLLIVLAVAGPLVAVRQSRLHYEAEQARVEAQRTLYFSDMSLAMRDWEEANLERCGSLLKRHMPASEKEEDLRGFEWYYLWRLWRQGAETPVIFRDEQLESMAVSADHRLMAVGNLHGDINLIELASGKILRRWKAHPYNIYSLEFSQDGAVLASASIDNEVAIWETDSGNRIRKLSGARVITISQDGKRFAYGAEDASIAILDDLQSEPRIIKKAHEIAVSDLVFSPDGNSLASTGWNSQLSIWDVESGEKSNDLRGHRGGVVWSVAWSPDGRYVASGDTHGKTLLWDAQDGTLLQSLERHRDTINAVQFSSDSSMLITASSDNTVKVWDVPNGWLLRQLRGHFADVIDVGVSSQGKRLLTASMDGTIKQWPFDIDVNRDVLNHSTGVNAIAFSPAGDYLATFALDGAIRIWGTAEGNLVTTQPAHEGYGWSLVWTRFDDQEVLVSAGGDGFVRIWKWIDNCKLQLKRTLPCNESPEDVMALALDASGTLIAFQNSHRSIAIWDLRKDQLRDQFQSSSVDQVCFVGEDQLAVSNVNQIFLYDLKNGSELSVTQGASRLLSDLKAAPAGKGLASTSNDRTIRIWSLDQASRSGPLRLLSTLRGHASPVSAVDYSLDGKLLGSTGQESVVRLWDVDGGFQRAAFQGHADDATDVAFSPDGQILASASNDGTVRLWRAPPIGSGAPSPNRPTQR